MARDDLQSDSPTDLEGFLPLPKITVACVYRTGGDYSPDYVRRLAVSVHKHLDLPHNFICLSDDPVVADLPLWNSWPGWWSKIELFRLRGPLLYFDLDTMIVGDITPLAKHTLHCNFVSQQNWVINDGLNSQMLGWSDDLSWVYVKFKEAQKQLSWGSARIEGKKYPGDQEWIGQQLTPERWARDVQPGIYSYKHHCRNGLPDDVRVVCFHGKPRPHEIGWKL